MPAGESLVVPRVLAPMALAAALALVPDRSWTAEVFPRPLFIPLEERPEALHAADLNDDGWIDLATAQPAAGTVAVLIHSGGSTERALFAPPEIHDVGLNPLAIDSGDIDRENGRDLVVVNSGSASISTLLNRGDGRLGPGRTVAAGVDPRVGRLGDLNGDGNLDLVAGNASSRELQVILGDGRGRFSSRTEVEIGGNPHALALEDFDGDDLLDLVAVYANDLVGGVQWLQGRGNGKFQAPVKTTLGAVDDAVPRLIAPGDFNQDGLLDLAVVTDDERLLRLGFEHGGRFAVKQVAVLDAQRARVLVAADFDLDGALDVLVPVEDGGNAGLRIHRGDGEGDFAHLTDVYFSGSLQGAILDDLDKDGWLDMAGTQSGPNGVSVVRGAGPGRLGVRTRVPLGASPKSLAALDLDGDGTLELAAPTASALHLVAASPAGDFSRFRRIELPGRALADAAVGSFGLLSPLSVALLDLAQEEVLMVAFDPAEKGEVVETEDISAGDVPGSLAAGDLNGDGVSDLVITSQASGDLTVAFLTRDGGGVERRLKLDLGGAQTAVAIGDLDADGALDIAAGTRTAVHTLRNFDLGADFDAVEHSGLKAPRAMAVLPASGDGTPLLALATGDKVVLASPVAEAGELGRIEYAAAVECLIGADADGDGVTDLLAGVDASVAFSRAQPQGGFEDAELVPVSSTPVRIVLGPFTTTGRLDCATADAAARGLSILAGTALPAQPAGSFRRGDADGDGSLLLTDAVRVLSALFQAGGAPACEDAADADDSGSVNITDVIALLEFLFRGGPSPPAPGMARCAVDPTPDDLDCLAPCRP